MTLENNLKEIEKKLTGKSCRLIAVSKTKPASLLLEAYQAGCRLFGENKVQEMTQKWEELPKDIEWHMIGHLQSNKVKYIAPYVNLIHSIDSIKLLQEVDKQAKKNNRIIDCLLQIHIAEEETKFGLDENEARDLLTSDEFASLKNIRIKGVMGMATFTNDTIKVRKEFRHLRAIFESLKNNYQALNIDWKEVSMGMSGDYEIAIEEGSTLVRIGSSIFGSR